MTVKTTAKTASGRYDGLLKSKEYKTIKQDLLDQLDADGTTGEYYVDLVGDYMSLWINKTLLQADIRDRGVSVFYNNGGGQSGRKKNDSVADLIKTNSQMLKLLEALHIKPAGGVDDEL